MTQTMISKFSVDPGFRDLSQDGIYLRFWGDGDFRISLGKIRVAVHHNFDYKIRIWA